MHVIRSESYPEPTHSLRVQCPIPRRPSLAGISSVEVLVVLAIIGLLLATTLPSIARSRDAARRLTCLNNVRNISLALTLFEQYQGRLPASGLFCDPGFGIATEYHSWAVSVLPFLEQGTLWRQWDFDKALDDEANAHLTKYYIPNYVCPSDISCSDGRDKGDQSYAVNGGFGYTTRTQAGIVDCPKSPFGLYLDLNGDGRVCTGTATDDEDRNLFKQTGLFFLENWKQGATIRHFALADVQDGLSQTFLLTENVRTGFDPHSSRSTYASSAPRLCAFYVGLPCTNGNCTRANVDYTRCNDGGFRINSGILKPEGSSPLPNSFHHGGVNMGYADGHVTFLSEAIDGAVYASLASPQGISLQGGSLAQRSVSADEY